MIVVDTSVWIDYFNGVVNPETEALDGLLSSDIIVMGDIIYAEVLQGFRRDRDFRIARQLLDTLLFMEMLGKDLALKSAINFRNLRKRGITVRKTIDVFIATFCIEKKLPLLHNDRDFDPIALHLGLQVFST